MRSSLKTKYSRISSAQSVRSCATLRSPQPPSGGVQTRSASTRKFRRGLRPSMRPYAMASTPQRPLQRCWTLFGLLTFTSAGHRCSLCLSSAQPISSLGSSAFSFCISFNSPHQVFGIDDSDDVVYAPSREFNDDATPAIVDLLCDARDRLRQIAKKKGSAADVAALRDDLALRALPALAEKVGALTPLPQRALMAFDGFVKKLGAVVEKGGDVGCAMCVCDALRDDVLPELGVRLEDVAGKDKPFVWKMDDPAVLIKEREAKRAEAKAVERRKVENKLKTVKKEREKWEAASAPPEGLFEGGGYSNFDDAGLPQAKDGQVPSPPSAS
jgi:hypothetical protein